MVYILVFITIAMPTSMAYARSRSVIDRLQSQISYQWKLKNGKHSAFKVHVYISVPTTRDHQIVSDIEIIPKPIAYLDDEFDQKIACIELVDVAPGQEINICWNAKVTTIDKNYNIDPAKTKGFEHIPDDIIKLYTKDEDKYCLNSPVIKEAAKEASKGEKKPYWIAKNVLDYVHSRIRYEMDGRHDNIEQILLNGKGSCTEFAVLFEALCRANGLPAINVLGTKCRDNGIDKLFHKWSKVYIPPYGWIPFDATGGYFGRDRSKALILGIRGSKSEYLNWNSHFITANKDGKISKKEISYAAYSDRSCGLGGLGGYAVWLDQESGFIVNSSHDHLKADGKSNSIITATMKTPLGKPISDLDVQITLSKGKGTISSVESHPDGTYTATYTAPMEPCNETITVNVLGLSKSVEIKSDNISHFQRFKFLYLSFIVAQAIGLALLLNS